VKEKNKAPTPSPTPKPPEAPPLNPDPPPHPPAKPDVRAGFHQHFSAQEKQQLLNELHPGNPHPAPHEPGTIDGFPTHVFVEHGHGVTQEFQDLVNAHGIDLTPQQYDDAYHYVEPIVGGRFFLDDPMYRMNDGDLGISRAGNAVWNPEAVRAYLHWLNINGFES
jgi:hypothetical protein